MHLLGTGTELYKELRSATNDIDAYAITDRYVQSIAPGNASLLSGLAGLGFCLLAARPTLPGFVANCMDGWLEQIDEVIWKYAHNCLQSGHYDYFTGCFGGLFYLIHRADVPTNRKRAKALLTALTQVTVSVDGRRMIESPENLAKGVYEYGVAHGQAGYVAVLSHALRVGLGNDGIRNLYDDLRATLYNVREVNGHFPDVAENGYLHYVPYRWCRGEFGTLATLYFAEQRLGEEASTRALVENLGEDANLETYLNAYVTDYTFCHGRQGFEHIVDKLNRAVDSAQLDELQTQASSVFSARATGEEIDYAAQTKGILQGDLSVIPAELNWDTVTLL